MIKPYTAVGLIPTVRGIRKRADIMRNIEHLTHLVKAASWLSSLDLPVRLIAFPGSNSTYTGTYNFLVTGSESANTIRIQIKDSANNVIYDTQPGDADTATPTTMVTAGTVLA